MHFDLRLYGETADGRKCVLVTSVYASSQKQLQKEARRASEAGPWYYQGTSEPVPEGVKIVVEHVKPVTK